MDAVPIDISLVSSTGEIGRTIGVGRWILRSEMEAGLGGASLTRLAGIPDALGDARIDDVSGRLEVGKLAIGFGRGGGALELSSS